ncbi:MAG: beta-galactosidase [Thaumarchaeota archaeon]|nr:beta-galactosidase [Nitrososphaerota archaeon]
MNKKILAGAIAAGIIAVVIAVILLPTQTTMLQKNEKLGLYILTPSSTPTLSDLKEAYAEAASTGIGRSNVYLFWSTLEPQQGQYDWKIPDALMSLNKQNDLKVTLYFSIINNRVFGPFPTWMGEPKLDDNLKEKTVKILDNILSRYGIIDHVIIGGEVDAYFYENDKDITKYEEFFTGVYNDLKEKHPNIKFGNSFSLHGVLNHKQEDLVNKLNQGDFVAFTYFPVNTLNEIDKTPEDAGKNLEKILDLAGNKPVALMEVSWSTAESVGGSNEGQVKFMKIVYDFYRKNEQRFEFLSWFRQYDRSIESCMKGLNTSFDVSFGNEFVLKHTAEYICSAGLIDVNKNTKPAWEEFKKQVQFNPNS